MPDPISAAVAGGGAALKIGGSLLSNRANQKGQSDARNTLNADISNLEALRSSDAAMYDPYLKLGTQGAQGLGTYDLMAGVGPAVSYDKEYTDKLGDYQSSPAFQAQNTLGQQVLGRASHARGLDTGRSAANAQGEQTQKLISTDYDKYRGDLAQRYKALQGEYGLRRENNQNRYTQLMDMTKLGQGAANSVTGLNQNYAGKQSADRGGIANSQISSGQSNANMWSGLGSVMSNSLTSGGISSMFGGGAKPYNAGGANFSGNEAFSGAVDNYGDSIYK